MILNGLFVIMLLVYILHTRQLSKKLAREEANSRFWTQTALEMNIKLNEVKKASTLSNEKVWELPLWEEYTREIKGKYADIQTIGQGRLAGTITAGAC